MILFADKNLQNAPLKRAPQWLILWFDRVTFTYHEVTFKKENLNFDFWWNCGLCPPLLIAYISHNASWQSSTQMSGLTVLKFLCDKITQASVNIPCSAVSQQSPEHKVHKDIQVQRSQTPTQRSPALARCCIKVFIILQRERRASVAVRSNAPLLSSRGALHSYDSAEQKKSAITRHQCFIQRHREKGTGVQAPPTVTSASKTANQREAELSQFGTRLKIDNLFWRMWGNQRKSLYCTCGFSLK